MVDDDPEGGKGKYGCQEKRSEENTKVEPRVSINLYLNPDPRIIRKGETYKIFSLRMAGNSKVCKARVRVQENRIIAILPPIANIFNIVLETLKLQREHL